MAVKDENAVYSTESFILKRARKHYKIPIRSLHWQLRSLISVEGSNVIYFPGGVTGNHVQRLNINTKECDTLKILSFSPRCLVAERGWLCCGGETGEFSAISLNALDEYFDKDPDDPDAGYVVGPIRSTTGPSNKSLLGKSMKLASDRVNCITLWFPDASTPGLTGNYMEPVAILANNDCTVALVNVNDFHNRPKIEPFDVITYPDFVNRALLSPDGRLLIAILDDPFLYVHRRIEKKPQSHHYSRSRHDVAYAWEPYGQILLKSQQRDDKTTNRGSFAACFNASGTLLAVGTQYGTISIFDTATLGHPTLDPLITSFQSSQPNRPDGAVRAMAFAPGPFDLLAWTEDRAHVGIADVRTGFLVRQTLNLNVPDFEVVNILDRETIDPRLLEGRGTADQPTGTGHGGVARNASGLDSRRRRELGDRFGSPLTEEETTVLEALQAERRRRDRLARAAEATATAATAAAAASASSGAPSLPMPVTPYQIWQASQMWAESGGSGGVVPITETRPPAARDRNAFRPSRERSSSVSRALGTTGPSRERSASVSRAIGDLLGSIRDQRERAQERVRSAQTLLREARETQERQRLDRERAGMPRQERTIADGAAALASASAATGSGASALRSMRAAAVGVGAGADPGSAEDRSGGNPWNDLETLYDLSFETPLLEQAITQIGGGGAGADADAGGDDGARGAQDRDRDRAALLPLLNRVYSTDFLLPILRPESATHDGPPKPDNTSGLAWSEDGRILFIGAENGIYEFHVNVQSRKFIPSISMR